MPPVERVLPAEAAARLGVGWVYVDVRVPQEFELGHPPGAYNVPIADVDGRPNARFVAVVEATFAVDVPLVVGCGVGLKSQRAAAVLAAGGRHVAELVTGFDGRKDPFGTVVDPGWKRCGLPVEEGDGGERGWSALSAK